MVSSDKDEGSTQVALPANSKIYLISWFSFRPVTAEIAGSSPVRSRRESDNESCRFLFFILPNTFRHRTDTGLI